MGGRVNHVAQCRAAPQSVTRGSGLSARIHRQPGLPHIGVALVLCLGLLAGCADDHRCSAPVAEAGCVQTARCGGTSYRLEIEQVKTLLTDGLAWASLLARRECEAPGYQTLYAVTSIK
jgi:hypothetical protein